MQGTEFDWVPALVLTCLALYVGTHVIGDLHWIWTTVRRLCGAKDNRKKTTKPQGRKYAKQDVVPPNPRPSAQTQPQATAYGHDVMTQSQTTYTSVSGHSVPRFKPLADYNHGAWRVY